MDIPVMQNSAKHLSKEDHQVSRHWLQVIVQIYFLSGQRLNGLLVYGSPIELFSKW